MPDSSRQTFWSSLDPAARENLLRGCRIRRYRPGEHLCYQGEPPDHMLILREGWVKVWKTDENGHECVIAVRGPGDLIGEAGLLAETDRTATVTALHGVTALSVPRGRFNGFLNEHPGAWPKVFGSLSRRLNQSDERIMALGGRFGAARLAVFMLRLAADSGQARPEGGVRIPPLSQAELGSCVDSSRETVARALREWRELGFVETGWRRTTILDPDGLRAHAETYEGS
ncbi:Crp/Fnr family transcriptional regulator [Actinocorallia aurantiaca]|jgi:CRP/FNR family cyclic AMP-dependent transcriptional regulator|uniref:Crp/Fnr family transcriptional regulator n=1 Tax=Actinocorallia aurantiaca TaxID=46204 RepID=A0ABP6GTF0_9ACTN